MEYILSDDESYYILSGIGTATDTDIVIPATHNNLPVSIVGDGAFAGCKSLKSVMFGENSQVTTIGKGAFGSFSLTSIEIPEKVTTIDEMAFGGCYSLTSITVDDDNPNYKSVDGNLYSKDGATFIQYAAGKKATSFTLPNSVTVIGNYAFAYASLFGGEMVNGSSVWGNSSLESVIIGDGVTFIGKYAFARCSNLTSVTMGNSMNSIADYAFAECTSLTNVTMGNSINTIGLGVFTNCRSLTNIIIPDSVTTIGDGAFGKCDSLTNVTIGNGVTSIGKYAFYGCSLVGISIPDSVTSIGNSAFDFCDSLTSVTFKNISGWKAGSIDISSTDLADAPTAAEYLTQYYCDYAWTRSDE